MKVFLTSALLAVMMGYGGIAEANQTFVFIRHGEKPDNDSGQLTCKGLNRALSIPQVLLGRYGTPDAIFASAPKTKKIGSSLRPLTTITPTAIRISQPVDLRFRADDTTELAKTLLTGKPHPLVFLSWEHKNLVVAAKKIINMAGGDDSVVLPWAGSDFDGIYVIKLDDAGKFIAFSRETEGLNGVPDTCPNT
ncbi:histidine phosphatase family protein [Musicola paradisiaca]|uniref:Histidine phosphatase family protein n=1 Tax=Musicola paradisiaca (strain Ech703) TaxID=579405 RepID=C6CDC2_MUSP7|nr:hypothetical protein [Musicola paradisiaca]ACS86993.1 conserved hypothetical protein [Musicola paradisiaca Ech703]